VSRKQVKFVEIELYGGQNVGGRINGGYNILLAYPVRDYCVMINMYVCSYP
jgi:hypothetical protein